MTLHSDLPGGSKVKREFHCGDQWKYHIVITLFKSVKQFGKEGFSLHLILDQDMQASTARMCNSYTLHVRAFVCVAIAGFKVILR